MRTIRLAGRGLDGSGESAPVGRHLRLEDLWKRAVMARLSGGETGQDGSVSRTTHLERLSECGDLEHAAGRGEQRHAVSG